MDSEQGNSFLSQKAVLVLGGLQPVIKAEAFSCEGHGLQWQKRGRKTKGGGEEEERKASKQDFLIGPTQVQASHKKHSCSETYCYFDPTSTLLMAYISKDLWRTLRSLSICPPPS